MCEEHVRVWPLESQRRTLLSPALSPVVKFSPAATLLLSANVQCSQSELLVTVYFAYSVFTKYLRCTSSSFHASTSDVRGHAESLFCLSCLHVREVFHKFSALKLQEEPTSSRAVDGRGVS